MASSTDPRKKLLNDIKINDEKNYNSTISDGSYNESYIKQEKLINAELYFVSYEKTSDNKAGVLTLDFPILCDTVDCSRGSFLCPFIDVKKIWSALSPIIGIIAKKGDIVVNQNDSYPYNSTGFFSGDSVDFKEYNHWHCVNSIPRFFKIPSDFPCDYWSDVKSLSHITLFTPELDTDQVKKNIEEHEKYYFTSFVKNNVTHNILIPKKNFNEYKVVWSSGLLEPKYHRIVPNSFNFQCSLTPKKQIEHKLNSILNNDGVVQYLLTNGGIVDKYVKEYNLSEDCGKNLMIFSGFYELS